MIGAAACAAATSVSITVSLTSLLLLARCNDCRVGKGQRLSALLLAIGSLAWLL